MSRHAVQLHSFLCQFLIVDLLEPIAKLDEDHIIESLNLVNWSNKVVHTCEKDNDETDPIDHISDDPVCQPLIWEIVSHDEERHTQNEWYHKQNFEN